MCAGKWDLSGGYADGVEPDSVCLSSLGPFPSPAGLGEHWPALPDFSAWDPAREAWFGVVNTSWKISDSCRNRKMSLKVLTGHEKVERKSR